MTTVVRRVGAGAIAGASGFAGLAVAGHVAVRLGLLKPQSGEDEHDRVPSEGSSSVPFREVLPYILPVGVTWGGVYGLVRPLLPAPPPLAGAAYGLSAHVALYALSNRLLAVARLPGFEPRISDLVAHALAGVWLGEVERRLRT